MIIGKLTLHENSFSSIEQWQNEYTFEELNIKDSKSFVEDQQPLTQNLEMSTDIVRNGRHSLVESWQKLFKSVETVTLLSVYGLLYIEF